VKKLGQTDSGGFIVEVSKEEMWAFEDLTDAITGNLEGRRPHWNEEPDLATSLGRIAQVSQLQKILNAMRKALDKADNAIGIVEHANTDSA
jgi:hypothetical protein